MATTTAEITVQPTNDPNVMVYHTRFEMAPGPLSGAKGNDSDLNEFGRIILKLRGVASIQISPYVLLVTKALLFAWEEVDPYVRSILSQYIISQKQLKEAVDG